MAAIPLSRNTNMAAVTSRENTLIILPLYELGKGFEGQKRVPFYLIIM